MWMNSTGDGISGSGTSISVTPAQVVLISGGKEGSRLIDRQQEPRGKTHLRDLVDEHALLGKLRADRFEQGDLRRELGKAAAHLRLPRLHFGVARGAVMGGK